MRFISFTLVWGWIQSISPHVWLWSQCTQIQVIQFWKNICKWWQKHFGVNYSFNMWCMYISCSSNAESISTGPMPSNTTAEIGKTCQKNLPKLISIKTSHHGFELSRGIRECKCQRHFTNPYAYGLSETVDSFNTYWMPTSLLNKWEKMFRHITHYMF